MNPPPTPRVATDKAAATPPPVPVPGAYADLHGQGRVSVLSGSARVGKTCVRKPLCNGTMVGPYLVVSLMGEGGFGLTYAAISRPDNRQVVLKEHMPVGIAIRDADGFFVTTPTQEAEDSFQATLDEFRDEINILMALEHPGIVRILDAFEANGTAYYVMPLVQGSHLDIPKRAEMDHGLRSREARRVRQQLTSILNALAYLGQNQVVHRDIKPENILITPEGYPILLDFGSARQIRTGKEYSNVYTPAFCAPEQVASEHDPKWGKMQMGPWTDLYSLGACFYYCITRMLPPSAETRMFSHPADPYRPLAKRADLQEVYGDSFLKALDRALSLDVDERWQNAREWRAYLEKGTRTEKAWRWRDLIPYAVAAAFAVTGGGLLYRNIALQRECDRLYESSVTFCSNLMSDFYADMTDLPGSSPIQEKFCRYLDDYMQRTDGLGTSSGRGYRENAALAHLNLGKYFQNRGNLPSALENLSLAENDMVSLVEAVPTDYQYRCALAQIRTQRAAVLHCLGKDTEAAQAAASAIGIMRVLCRAVPKSPDYVGTLCGALLLEANIEYDNGHVGAATAVLGELNERLDANLSTFAQHRVSLQRKAEAVHLGGLLALDAGQPDAAEQCFGQELEIFSRLLEKNKYSLSYLEGQARAMFYIAHVYSHRAAADPDNADYGAQAMAAYNAHIDKCLELERLDAERPSSLYAECNSLSAVQEILLHNGQINLSESYATKLMRKSKLLHQLSPDHVDHTRMLASAWCAVADLHSRMDQAGALPEEKLAEGQAILDKLLGQAPGNCRVLRTGAKLLETSARLAADNGDHAAAASYRQQALALVEKLCAAYPQNALYAAMRRRAESCGTGN